MKQAIIWQKWLRYLQSLFLSLIMLGLLFLGGFELFGREGLLVLAILFIIFIVFLFQAKPLAVPVNAKSINYLDNPELYNIVFELFKQAHLAGKPKIYLLPSLQMNAATIGNKTQPSIILTLGLVQGLSAQELKGVLAHEISHIKQDDLTFFFFIESMRQITSFLARFGWIMILFFFPLLYVSGSGFSIWSLLLFLALPFLSLLVQLALLRIREFSADLAAVELTGDPQSLATALQKIDYQQKKLLSYFLPLRENKNTSLFKTHPVTAERVRRLMELKNK
jgi:heat shock protein HtpX